MVKDTKINLEMNIDTCIDEDIEKQIATFYDQGML